MLQLLPPARAHVHVHAPPHSRDQDGAMGGMVGGWGGRLRLGFLSRITKRFIGRGANGGLER